MVKTINIDAYSIIKKNPQTSLYDILLCNECNFTCLRNNFSRHKNSISHMNKYNNNHIIITEVVKEDKTVEDLQEDATILV